MLSKEFEKSSHIDKQRPVIDLSRKDDILIQYWKVYSVIKIAHCFFFLFF